MTPEIRESQLIALAVERVEQRLLDGTATSQEIIHFLKLGSMKEQLEMEKLKKENELLRAKTEAIKAEKQTAEMFAEAIEAMRSYRPPEDEEEVDD
jgi:hypothetical protein